MADLTSRLIVRLIDGVSGPAKAAAGALNRLSRASTAGSGLIALQQRVAAESERNNAAIAGLQDRLFAATASAFAPFHLASAIRMITASAAS